MKNFSRKQLQNREDRKRKHNERAQKELQRLTKKRDKIIPYHWSKVQDEEVSYLIVEFNFTKKTTPKKFLALLEEKIGDQI